jgi:hypothetical protein
MRFKTLKCHSIKYLLLIGLPFVVSKSIVSGTTDTVTLFMSACIAFFAFIIGVSLVAPGFYNRKIVPKVIVISIILFIVSDILNFISGNIYVDEMILCFVAIFGAFSFGMSGNKYVTEIITKKFWVLFIAFSLCGILSSILNSVPTTIAVQGGILIHKPLIILIIYLLFSIDEGSFQSIFKYLRFCIIFISITAVFYLIVFEIILDSNPIPGLSDIEGTYLNIPVFRSFFIHPGSYSSVMIIISNYFIVSYFFKKKKIDLLFSAMTTLALFSSLRLKVILLLPITAGTIFYFYITKENKSIKILNFKRIFSTTFCLIILLSLLYITQEKLFFYSSSSNVRKELLNAAIDLSKENLWLGAGYGRFGSAISVRYYSPLYFKYRINKLWGGSQDNPAFVTDQWWGWFIGETGIAGMLFFCAGMISMLYELRKIGDFWHYKNPNISVLAYTSMGALIYGVLSGFAAGSLSAPPACYIMLAITAITAKAHFSGLKE